MLLLLLMMMMMMMMMTMTMVTILLIKLIHQPPPFNIIPSLLLSADIKAIEKGVILIPEGPSTINQ